MFYDDDDDGDDDYTYYMHNSIDFGCINAAKQQQQNMTNPTILKHKINDGANNNVQLWRVTFNLTV